MKKQIESSSLGGRERQIMEIVWGRTSATVRDVYTELQKKEKIAYTTVMTIMSRLCDKKLLCRRVSDNGSYVYSPKKDKQTYFEQVSHKIIHSLLHDYGDVAVAQFFDILDDSDIDIQKLRKKLRGTNSHV